MEQQSALLAVWYEGATIASLSHLLEQPADRIEDHLRQELHKLRNDAATPTAPPPVVAIAPPAAKPRKAKPGQALRRKMADECDVKRAQPGTPKTAPTSLVKTEVALGPVELRGYPATMRRSNQETPRRVYQQLKGGPKKLDEIAEALGVSCDAVWLACRNMLKAGLVARTEGQPYRWQLVERPADAATGD